MKIGLAQNTPKSAKTLAQQIAKQIAEEPIEILNSAKAQVTGVEASKPAEKAAQPQPQNSEDQAKLIQHQNEIHDKMKSSRRMEALNRELADIHKQDIFKDLQARIAQGEEIPLEDYSELSPEQKQVLKAQMEAVKFQRKQTEYAQAQEGFSMPQSKKGRKMGGGQKQEAEKQQTHVEKPVPPSG